MKKRILSVILIIAMVVPYMTNLPVYAASLFNDIANHWAKDTIEELAEEGIVNGKGDGTYDPEGLVTRAEFMKLLVCIDDDQFDTVEGSLADVSTGDWFNPYVYSGLSKGVFSLDELDNNQFRPNDYADRETVATWAMAYLGIIGDYTTTTFADNGSIQNKTAVATAQAEGIIQGYEDNTFRPSVSLTRAEAATIIKRVMEKYEALYGLRDAKNIVDYKDDVDEITATATTNILEEADTDTGKFVFSSIDDDIKNLQDGDLFMIKPCDAIPTGVAIRVADISISGDTATIMQGDISLDDIVDEIDIATSVPVTAEYITYLGEGVTLLDNEDLTYFSNVDDALNYGSIDGKLSMNLDMSYKVDDYTTLKLEGDISLTELIANADLSYSKGDLSMQVTTTQTIESELEISGSAKYDYLKDYSKTNKATNTDALTEGQYTSGTNAERTALAEEIFKLWEGEGLIPSTESAAKDVKLASFNVPLAYGFFLILDININVSATGEVSVSVTHTSSTTSGFSYADGELTKISKSDNDLDFAIAGKVEVKAGPEIRGGITWLYVLTLDVGAGAGVGARASVEIPSISFDLDDDCIIGVEELPSLEELRLYQHITEEDVHICDICMQSEVFAYASLDVQIKVGYGMFSVSRKAEVSVEASQSAAYLSVDFSRDDVVVRALGECPYCIGVPGIKSQTESKEIQIGKDMTLEITEPTSNGTYSRIYQWYLNGTAIPGATDDIYQVASLELSDAGTYNCVVAYADYPTLFACSDDIEIEADMNTLEGGTTTTVTADVKQYTGSVSESNKAESFTYTAPVDGDYLFTNSGAEQVLINLDGAYTTNEGIYTLKAGQTYTFSVEWRLDETDFVVSVFAPNSYQDISGMVEVDGKFTFAGEVQGFTYVPEKTDTYRFETDVDAVIKICDSSGNCLMEGNPSAWATLTGGATYRIMVTCPSQSTQSYTMELSNG